MRTRSIIAVLLLLVAGLQTSWAQGFRVYKSDGTVAQFSMRTDSIVFYDGIGSDVDFGPFTPVNQCIVGTWYESFNRSITFNEDSTTDFIAGATYKFLPYQGTVIFYNASGEPIRIIKIHDLTADQMVMSVLGSNAFHVLSKTQPAQPVSISCAEAVQLTYALEDGASSAEPYTVEGYITEVVFDVSRNQQTFWMADTKDGGRVFEAYWANLPEGVTEFKAGMKVAITGLLMKYVNNAGNVICEIKNAEVVILEDGGGDVPPVVGTDLTCAQAVEMTNALADGATSEETYSVTGYITEVIGSVSRNQQSFWMADTKDGGKVFEAYWANLPEGVTEFKAGMKVKITGQLMKYVNSAGNVTCEIKNADVVILENGGGDVPPIVGMDITCAQAVELTNALPDGTISEETYSVTGYITELLGSVSRNQQSFWMADTKDGGKVFEAYWANLPEGTAEFKVGMKVKITGQLMKYVKNEVVTAEIKNADVVILEDGGGEQGGIQHVSIAEFLAKADDSTTYELTGTVRKITNTTYGNFYLFEGNDSIYIYGLLDKNGEPRKFASLGIAEGDIVTLTGTYFFYNETPEIKDAQFVSVVKSGDNPDPNPGGDVLTDLVNGGFESWESDTDPTGWKSASTAGNAFLLKSDEARSGSFSCTVVAGGTYNRRLATQEIALEAGSYTFSFYAKSTTADVCQTRGGYVPVNADGSVGTYRYGDYVNINNSEWTLVTYDFELTEKTTLCLIVMNPKDSSYSVSQDILVDDAALVKK